MSRIRHSFRIALLLIFPLVLEAASQLHAGNGQDGKISNSSDGVWKFSQGAVVGSATPQIDGLRFYRAVTLNRSVLEQALRRAPMEFGSAAKEQRVILTLPAPDGRFLRFSITESPILASELAARFPEIKTYSGQGIDEPGATTRFDWTPAGFHAIVLSQKGTVLVEPQSGGDSEHHIVYFQHDVAGASFQCDVTGEAQEAAIARNQKVSAGGGMSPAVVSGTTLRTYRLAAAATAEYTQTYGGGTISGALSAITTTVNLVDAIYEREVAIRLTLIANETSILFTNSATDGYTSDNANAMLSENQTKLDSVIGSANYDIGHVFDGHTQAGGSFSWQGVASIGSVCVNSSKGRGVDIFRSVSPTSVFAYYSASHEMGHQFGATHTFNANTGSCGSQRTASTAYEPVNGSTIMAYRYACAPEDLMSLDTYFHNASIEQIVNYTTTGSGNGCAAPSSTGNNPPSVNAPPTYTIPMRTPFTLTASGSDPDGDTLAFGWEEFDLGAAAPPDTDDGSRPIFRSFAPTASPSRILPRLEDVLSGTATFGESMPTTTRTMNFRVTARDNRTGGGGIASAATQVNVNSGAGPFTVDQPSTGTNWEAGTAQTVNWSVANTTGAPVNCSNVRITLSTDGGITFPIVLSNSTPNDGSEIIIVPGAPSPDARVKVEGIGNVFFNISRGFGILPSTSTPTPTPTGTPGTLGNISTRLRVETGDNALIGGFIITGTQPKKVIIRAIGPSLSSFFSGALADPVLELHGPGAFVTMTNDNWRTGGQEAEIIATGIAPSNDFESAIMATLPANNAAYTAIVRGANNATGIGVVEAYDLDNTVDSKLGNISTRGLVQTNDNVMIGGLIVLGENPLRVILRAIGPSLPVAGALGDPTLELHDGNGALIAANDDWRSDQEAEIIATGIPPSNDLEAAIVRNFAPGNYTAIVRGVNNTTGIALVEAFGLN
jgi:Metallo-peptidase family M12B Reprolysin-like